MTDMNSDLHVTMPDGTTVSVSTDLVGKPLVYLAGPYTLPSPDENVRETLRRAEEILAKGEAVPLVPHLTQLWDLYHHKAVEGWYAYDLALLARCDALFRLPGPSRGAEVELQFAHARGIPAFDNDNDLDVWLAERAKQNSLNT